MKFNILILVIFFLCRNSFGLQDNKTSDSLQPYFRLHSIHLDLTTAIFINDISIYSDFEIYRISLQSFGIMAGYSNISAGSVGGKEYGSPFQDLNLLAYTSIGYDKFIKTQFILGYVYRMSGSWTNEYPVSGLKYGISFILNPGKYFKAYVKYSAVSSSARFGMSAVGLGISAGWER